MDINIIKTYLRDTHAKIVLDDMKGLTDIKDGMVIMAKTRTYLAENEIDLAKEIASELPKNMFSFYSINESLKQIRYGVLSLDKSTLIS